MNDKYTAKDIVFTIGLGIITTFFIISLVFWTIIPYSQAKTFVKAVEEDNLELLLQDSPVFSPYTHVQQRVRFHFLGEVLEALGKIPNPESVLDHAISKLEQLTEREPFSARTFSLLAQAYDKKAQILNDVRWYEKGEEFHEKALTLVPLRQDISYPYAFNLVYQGKTLEAIELLREVLAANENVPKSHFYLGLALASGDKVNFVEALNHLEIAFSNPSFIDPEPQASKPVYDRLFVYFYKKKNKDDLIKVLSRLRDLDPTQVANYQNALDFIQKTGQIPVIEFE